MSGMLRAAPRRWCGHPKAPADAWSTGAVGSGSELQELAGGAFDLQPLVGIGDRAGVGGGGDRHVPKGLDRPFLFDLVDRLAELARHATVARDAIAETLDERVND